MTSPVVAAGLGLLVVLGVIAIIAGSVRRVPPTTATRSHSGWTWSRLTRRPAGAAGRRRDVLFVVSILAGVATTAVTGWVLALVILPLAVLGLPVLLSVPVARDVALLEALDRWVRSLSATLPTGRSITDAIRLSRRNAPPLLEEPLGLLVARLNNRWDTRDALLRFADDLDSADADGVIAALMLAARRGSSGASVTLESLANSLQSQLSARRVIETERAKPYLVVRQVTAITVVSLGLALVLGRGYFAPYETPLGQLILAVLLAAYAGTLVLMRRRAGTRQRDRILVGVVT